MMNDEDRATLKRLLNACREPDGYDLSLLYLAALEAMVATGHRKISFSLVFSSNGDPAGLTIDFPGDSARFSAPYLPRLPEKMHGNPLDVRRWKRTNAERF